MLKTTEKFQEAADEQALILLHDWCKENRPRLLPMFGLIQEYRKWSKLKNTYIDGYLACINSATGRIHPDLMPLATQTGRFACRKPNLQNQVSSGIDPIGVRNFIVAPEGWVLLEADYSQVELRIAAYLSGDRTMLDAYRNGADIHAITTSAIFGISLEEASGSALKEFQQSFIKFLNNKLYSLLYQVYPKLQLVADEQGTSEFQTSFRKYVVKNRPLPNLLNEYSFGFCDSKDELLIQLADIIAGTIGRTFNEPQAYNFLEMLRGKIIQLDEFPAKSEPYWGRANPEDLKYSRDVFLLARSA